MTKVVRIHEYGGSDVLKIEEDEIGAPGPDEVLLNQKGMALHYADTMLREGRYFLKPNLPAVVGLDGTLDISVSREYAIDDIAHAQEDLVARKTTGSVIIVP
ncbi:MAG: hypothetical protein VX700_06145 [Pseudomonadota bacterium]|nr:hypothetical protein [Pseudomonadota bacterium]